MLLQVFPDDTPFVAFFLRPVAELAGFFVLLLGIMWFVYMAYEARRRGSFKNRKVEEWNFDVTKFLKILSYLGFVVGIFAILSGAGGLILQAPPSNAFQLNFGYVPSTFTSIFLIILGILTFLKPINDLPIASIIGLLAGTVIVIIMVLVIPQNVIDAIDAFIDYRIVLAIVFIVVFALAALTAKFYVGLLMSISKLISWPPLALILSVFCFIQGFLILVLGVSITGIF